MEINTYNVIFLDFFIFYSVSHSLGVPTMKITDLSPFFVSWKPWKIGSVSNTYLPHCIYLLVKKNNI